MEKIVQIIPAPANMRVHYENLDPDALRDKKGRPVAESTIPVCLALVELVGGDREIVPVTMDKDGCFELSVYSEYFVAVTVD